MKPTEEQIREFWEWCGLGCIHYWKFLQTTPLWGLDCIKCGKKYRSSQWATGHAPVIGDHKDYPPIDLNNLMKYAPRRITVELWRTILRRWVAKIAGDYEKDTLALFWAIGLTP
jgi:hypothetical protein